MQIRNTVPGFALLAGASFFAYDLTHDVWDGSESTLHIVLEAIVFAITLAAHFIEDLLNAGPDD